MIDTDKYEGLTIDDWYKMNHHDWKDVVNEHNDLLAEVKRLRMYEVAWKILYDNAKEEERETRTRNWKEIMELVRCDVREMVDTGDAVFDEWAKRTIGGFE